MTPLFFSASIMQSSSLTTGNSRPSRSSEGSPSQGRTPMPTTQGRRTSWSGERTRTSWTTIPVEARHPPFGARDRERHGTDLRPLRRQTAGGLANLLQILVADVHRQGAEAGLRIVKKALGAVTKKLGDGRGPGPPDSHHVQR